jgi:hypothetical protein
MLSRIFGHKATSRLRTLDRQMSIYIAEETYGWARIDKWTCRQTNGLKDRQIDEAHSNRWMCGKLTDGKMEGWTAGRMDGRMDGWVSGWMGERVRRWMISSVSRHVQYARAILLR